MGDQEKIVQLLDEDADDAYCELLYQSYLKDPDRGQFYTEDEVYRELGIAH